MDSVQEPALRLIATTFHLSASSTVSGSCG